MMLLGRNDFKTIKYENVMFRSCNQFFLTLKNTAFVNKKLFIPILTKHF